MDGEGPLIIDGKQIAANILDEVRRSAATLHSHGRAVTLAAVLIGDDPSAKSYAESQARRAEGVGLRYELVALAADTDPQQAAAALNRLGRDSRISGIMLHLPVPAHLDAFALQGLIPSEKDVEGVGPANLGLLFMGRPALVPCTAAAAFACLQAACSDLVGREVVVVGRSIIVGKPVAALLLAAHATVTQCHTRTRDLALHTRRADILVVAAGVPNLIGREHIRSGAFVIDVGTHRVTTMDAGGNEQTQTVGDVRFTEAADVAAAITPVPGGVGPVTVAMLLRNTVLAAEKARGLDTHREPNAQVSQF